MPEWLLFLMIGSLAGVISGMFGVGGGIVIVPALVYFAAFTQHKATGTSLAILLPPIGLMATLEYYKHGNVDRRAAMIIAVAMIAGAWLGAIIANKMSGPALKFSFGIFIVVAGLYLMHDASKRLGWI